MNNEQIKIDNALLAHDLNGYSEEAQNKKNAFHKSAKKLLKAIAGQLGIQPPYRLDTNMGGIAVCGETTLHSDSIYIQLSDSLYGKGNQIMYRTCTSQKDYSGGPNKFVSISDFSSKETQDRVLKEMASMLLSNNCNHKTSPSPSRRM